ncbi:MAG: hypothetical protein AABY65_14060 [Nitrospirota bacterium]
MPHAISSLLERKEAGYLLQQKIANSGPFVNTAAAHTTLPPLEGADPDRLRLLVKIARALVR